MLTCITIDGIELSVEYHVTKYYPATRFEPAEPSELIIDEVKVGDTDVSPLLSNYTMKLVEQKAKESFHDFLYHDEDLPPHVSRQMSNEYRI